MPSVVTVTRLSDRLLVEDEIIHREVFNYPETAGARADELMDVYEAKRLEGMGHYVITCREDAYSHVEDNALSVKDASEARLNRIAEDRKEARRIRGN